MGKYTVLNNHKADLAIQKRLDFIVDEITTRIDAKIKSIILTGGFGRGEGGVVKEKDEYIPVNDFDIGVIVSTYDYIFRRKKLQNNLTALVHDLSPKVGVKQIDAGISHFYAFKFAPNLVNWYEILYGHKILFGDISINKIMPNLTGENLPLLDGAIYFLSRGSGLLISALYFLPDWNINEKNRENFKIEIDKACMAMGDAILLLKNKYHYSYKKRKDSLTNLEIDEIPNGLLIKKMYISAINRKLYPKFEWSDDNVEIKKWFNVRKIFSDFFLWFESNRFKRIFSNWITYSEFINKYVTDSFQDKLRYIIKTGIINGLKRNPIRSKTFCWKVMPLILFSIDYNNVNYNMLNKAELYMDIENDSDNQIKWINIAINYLRLFHPEGVIRSFTDNSNINTK